MANIKKTITIPETRNRLKPYIAIYGGTYDGTKELSATDVLTTPLKEIGAVSEFSYKNDRKEIKYYRVFGENENGKIKETYPSLGDYELKFKTIVLYKNTFQEQFGWDPADIMFQDKPAIIQAVLKAPKQLPKRVLTFAGVWFQNNQLDFEADPDDMLIAYDITARASLIIPGEG
jgi:hypothetical protein